MRKNNLIINLYYHYPDTLYYPTFMDFYFDGHFYLKYKRLVFDKISTLLNNEHYFKYNDDSYEYIGKPLFLCSCGMIECCFADAEVTHKKQKIYFSNFVMGPNFEIDDTGFIRLGNDFSVTKKELEIALVNAYAFLYATSGLEKFFLEKYNLNNIYKSYIDKDVEWLLENGFSFLILYRYLKGEQDILNFLIDKALNDTSKATVGYDKSVTNFKSYFATQILFSLGNKISKNIWNELSKLKDWEILKIVGMALENKFNKLMNIREIDLLF